MRTNISIGRERLSLGSFPTRLTRHSRLGRELGVDLWVKHEFEADAFGSGNKVRKLEFLLADVCRRGYDGVVLDGATQSNCAMALSHYGPITGLDVELILYGQPVRQGNYLDILGSGANLTLLPQWAPEEIDEARCRVIHQHAKRGRRFFAVPTGATNSLTALAGVDLAVELANQERHLGVTFHHVILATGTGSTQVGLELGRRVLDTRWSLTGIAVAHDETFFQDVADRLYASPELAGLAGTCGAIELTTYGGAQGEGYGQPLAGAAEELREIRQRHGLVLDSVYTHKALTGLKQMISGGVIQEGSSVVFVHTGGINERFLEGCTFVGRGP